MASAAICPPKLQPATTNLSKVEQFKLCSVFGLALLEMLPDRHNCSIMQLNCRQPPASRLRPEHNYLSSVSTSPRGQCKHFPSIASSWLRAPALDAPANPMNLACTGDPARANSAHPVAFTSTTIGTLMVEELSAAGRCRSTCDTKQDFSLPPTSDQLKHQPRAVADVVV